MMGSIIAKFFIGAVGANFAFGAAMAVMPAYTDVRGDAAFYGYMMAALSGGFLVGALLSPYVERFAIGKIQIVAFCISALLWAASVLAPWNLLSILLFGAATIPIGATEVLISAVIQRIVPKHLLARTFSVMTSVSTSAMPMGALVGGAVGASIGSVATFSVAALGILLVSIVWFFVKDLRNLPKSKEIDPGKYGLTERVEISG
ncbi:Transmembrane secretion effector [Salinibacillus kushneri]|uniref:Transmembrane secretion effector n=1 Tax=Salinibacillus kushneri TaxID=237682 RepID=A0A1I0F0A1_9BACI|nr:Transmembrane secretion effector [Salinibacillus kushneri]